MILFFDDEALYVRPYVIALQAAHLEVTFLSSVGEAYNYFVSNLPSIEMAIVDIMSPILGSLPAGLDASKVEDGLRTGEELIRAMNRCPGGDKVKKLILTNVDATGFSAEVKLLDGVVAVHRKKDILPSELAEAVKRLLGR